jgi:hypothetical protein
MKSQVFLGILGNNYWKSQLSSIRGKLRFLCLSIIALINLSSSRK